MAMVSHEIPFCHLYLCSECSAVDSRARQVIALNFQTAEDAYFLSIKYAYLIFTNDFSVI